MAIGVYDKNVDVFSSMPVTPNSTIFSLKNVHLKLIAPIASSNNALFDDVDNCFQHLAFKFLNNDTVSEAQVFAVISYSILTNSE